ncbi:MAG: tol-pal system protein YbgF [Proteobacteria bacterium]|jgi:tol-pal system protein YbgF|nr:tol-pal system protein YbgF [Pseudomonadota bacterium]
MMQHRLYKTLAAGLLVAGLSGMVAAATSGQEMEQRVNRLERMVNSQGLVDIMLKLENLENEVQMLRGETEMLSHKLEEVKNRQRDLYLDLDRRILQLERATAGTSGTPSATTTGAVAAGASQAASKSATTAKTPTAASGKTGEGEQAAYQQAFDQLRNLHYEKASVAFSDFLKQYPNGRYAQIAQYWLAETNYAQRKFKQAIGDYQTMIDKYPSSPKVAEAMLKIGYSQYELKDYTAAESVLQKLIKSYPGTTEAGQAQNLLQKIRLKRGK